MKLIKANRLSHREALTDELASTTGRSSGRWFALIVLCLGALMIVLDTTIVNVALPSIRQDLGFSQTSLAWVVNAYLLTFGGFLLLSGWLGDLFGHRRLFLIGITLFTLASLACGMARAQGFLVTARVIQGLGGAVVSAVALSLIMNLFPEPAERAKAMGFFGFVAAGGGSIGVLLGGVLTNVLNWHWVFLVNLPVGVAVVALSLILLPPGRGPSTAARLDIAGAITVTASLLLAVYAIVNGNQVGWTSGQTIGLLVAAVVLLVLGYRPLEVGLAFLPANMIMAAFSLGLSAKLVTRFGIRLPIVVGLLLAAVGLGLFSRAPVGGNFATDVLPGMILLGLGAGMAFNPVLLAALSDVAPQDSGLASGVVNTSFMMGGALGLAILASLATAHTNSLVRTGLDHLAALNGGYQVAFLVAALFAVSASVLGATLLRFTTPTTPDQDESKNEQRVPEVCT